LSSIRGKYIMPFVISFGLVGVSRHRQINLVIPGSAII
jgi:hypothetical protein